jgi:hypothetical protein
LAATSAKNANTRLRLTRFMNPIVVALGRRLFTLIQHYLVCLFRCIIFINPDWRSSLEHSRVFAKCGKVPCCSYAV